MSDPNSKITRNDHSDDLNVFVSEIPLKESRAIRQATTIPDEQKQQFGVVYTMSLPLNISNKNIKTPSSASRSPMKGQSPEDNDKYESIPPFVLSPSKNENKINNYLIQ